MTHRFVEVGWTFTCMIRANDEDFRIGVKLK